MRDRKVFIMNTSHLVVCFTLFVSVLAFPKHGEIKISDGDVSRLSYCAGHPQWRRVPFHSSIIPKRYGQQSFYISSREDFCVDTEVFDFDADSIINVGYFLNQEASQNQDVKIILEIVNEKNGVVKQWIKTRASVESGWQSWQILVEDDTFSGFIQLRVSNINILGTLFGVDSIIVTNTGIPCAEHVSLHSLAKRSARESHATVDEGLTTTVKDGEELPTPEHTTPDDTEGGDTTPKEPGETEEPGPTDPTVTDPPVPSPTPDPTPSPTPDPTPTNPTTAPTDAPDPENNSSDTNAWMFVGITFIVLFCGVVIIAIIMFVVNKKSVNSPRSFNATTTLPQNDVVQPRKPAAQA